MALDYGYSEGGVDYSEVAPENPEFSVAPRQESRMRYPIRTPWEGLMDGTALKAFLGFAVVASDWPAQAGKKFISRSGWPATATRGKRPFEHRRFPGFFLADSFGTAKGDIPEGIGAGPTGVYDEATVGVELVSPRFGYRYLDDATVVEPAGGGFAWQRGVPEEYHCLRCMEIDVKQTTKAQQVPAPSGYVWEATGIGVTASMFTLLVDAEITIRWWPVPIDAFNAAAFDLLVNKTNAKTFPPSPPAGAPKSLLPQTGAARLIMGEPMLEIVRMGDQTWAYVVTLKMKRYRQGANKFWWPNPPAAVGLPGYYTALRASDGATVFQAADYETGFIPP